MIEELNLEPYDTFKLRIDGKFCVYISKNDQGYVVDACTDSHLIDTVTVWDNDLDEDDHDND